MHAGHVREPARARAVGASPLATTPVRALTHPHTHTHRPSCPYPPPLPRLDTTLIDHLQLRVTVGSVRRSLLEAPRLKLKPENIT